MNATASPESKAGRVEWLLGARWRGVLLVVVTSLLAVSVPMLFWVPGALVVLLGLGQRAQSCSAGLATWLAGWLLFALLQPMGMGGAALVAAVWMGPAYGWVSVLKRNISLIVGLQTGVLLVLGALALVHLWIPDTVGFWRPLLTEAIKPLGDLTAISRAAGLPGEWDVNKVITLAAERMWGVMAWLCLLNILAQVLGGLWLLGRLYQRPMLRPAFESVSLGRQLAWVAMALWVIASFTDNAMANDATWLFLGAFVVQGLSVCHTVARQRQVRGLAVVYGLLLFPWTSPVVQALLALVGYLDNWWDWRTRFVSER
jgi:hypothetical protein